VHDPSLCGGLERAGASAYERSPVYWLSSEGPGSTSASVAGVDSRFTLSIPAIVNMELQLLAIALRLGGFGLFTRPTRCGTGSANDRGPRTSHYQRCIGIATRAVE
jgi:hypothetical protein